jgi:hypothetical protein
MFTAVSPMTATTRTPSLTDLTDAHGATLEPWRPPAKPGGRPRAVDRREVIPPPACPAPGRAAQGICGRRLCGPSARSLPPVRRGARTVCGRASWPRCARHAAGRWRPRRSPPPGRPAATGKRCSRPHTGVSGARTAANPAPAAHALGASTAWGGGWRSSSAVRPARPRWRHPRSWGHGGVTPRRAGPSGGPIARTIRLRATRGVPRHRRAHGTWKAGGGRRVPRDGSGCRNAGWSNARALGAAAVVATAGPTSAPRPHATRGCATGPSLSC